MGLRSSFAELSTPAKAVIGVVVLGIVGIALIVGVAVAGTFVMGTGEDVSDAPEVRFSASETDDGMRITHQGGDSLDATEVLVVVGSSEKTWAARADGDGTVAEGDALTLTGDRGTTIELRYQGSVLYVGEV